MKSAGFGDVPLDSSAPLGSDDDNSPDFYGGDPGSFDGGDKPGRRKASQHSICERTIGERLIDGDHIVPEYSWKFLQSSGSATMSTDEFEQHRSVFESIPPAKLLQSISKLSTCRGIFSNNMLFELSRLLA